MEKETITIEIRQEVSITLLWIVAGVVLVVGTFLLMPHTDDLWPLVNATGLVVGIYLAALIFYVLRPPLGWRTRVFVLLVAAIGIGGIGQLWVNMESRTHWQAAQMLRIRAVIGRGIRTMQMTRPLLKVLDAYYQQSPPGRRTLAEVFKQLHPGAAAGTDVYKKQGDWDTMNIIVESLEPDRIVLVSQETYVQGRDPGFTNYDGKKGMVQEKYILTERGLEHVSEN